MFEKVIETNLERNQYCEIELFKAKSLHITFI